MPQSWYNSFLKKILAANVIHKSEIQEKRVLLLGSLTMDFAADEHPVIETARRYFVCHGAAECRYFIWYSSLTRAGESFKDFAAEHENTYDLVILLDGMEKTKSFMQIPEKIQFLCKAKGCILAFARTPLEIDTSIQVNYYEDCWRYEAQDWHGIFPECDVEMGIEMNPAYLIAAKLRCNKKQKELKSNAVAIYHCRAGRRITLQESKRFGYFSRYRELDEIGMKEQTDKCCFDHNYLDKYELFLQNMRRDKFRLLELGVFHGASERMWKEYFPYAEIYGVDINPSCKDYEEERIKIITMDLSDVENLEKLKEISPRVIIDDASHIWSHQIKALFTLFSALPSGGIYILEDMETSVNPNLYPGYADDTISVDEICRNISWVILSKRAWKMGKYAQEITKVGMLAEMLLVVKGSCILIKR